MNSAFARRPSRVGWLLLAMFVPLVLAAPALAERRGEPFHWNGHLSAGAVLEIHGVNGSIEVAPNPAGESVVDAEKWSRTGDPDRVKIEIERSRNRVAIRALYPHRWFGFDHDDVQVHFTVRVPAGVQLVLGTVNGSVEAEGLANRVYARTVNGSVHIDTADEAEARTVNGSMRIRATPRTGDLHFHSVNGSVRLEIPAEASVRVRAHTLNGTIVSNLPAASLRTGFIGRSFVATVGRGDAQVEVSTINGSIQVRRI